jgi:hypothetical protein
MGAAALVAAGALSAYGLYRLFSHRTAADVDTAHEQPDPDVLPPQVAEAQQINDTTELRQPGRPIGDGQVRAKPAPTKPLRVLIRDLRTAVQQVAKALAAFSDHPLFAALLLVLTIASTATILSVEIEEMRTGWLAALKANGSALKLLGVGWFAAAVFITNVRHDLHLAARALRIAIRAVGWIWARPRLLGSAAALVMMTAPTHIGAGTTHSVAPEPVSSSRAA